MSIRVCLALVTALICGGCAEDWKAKTYPAAGKVIINGEPPEGALVQLHPSGTKIDERNSRPWGLVKADGSYVLSTYDGEPGVPRGDYVFTITWPIDASVPSLSDRLNYKYSKPEQSQWKMTIKEGDNQLPLVEMKNVIVQAKPQSQRGRLAGMPAMPGVPRPEVRKGGR